MFRVKPLLFCQRKTRKFSFLINHKDMNNPPLSNLQFSILHLFYWQGLKKKSTMTVAIYTTKSETPITCTLDCKWYKMSCFFLRSDPRFYACWLTLSWEFCHFAISIMNKMIIISEKILLVNLIILKISKKLEWNGTSSIKVTK